MKNLVLVTRTDTQQRLADTLRSLPPVRGFTFTPVEGHGPQAAHDPSVSARDAVVGYTPQVRVDILLEDADVETVLAALGLAGGGLRGRCIYWVTPVERHGRF
jgi:nitrogen regulatory protein P-II 1